MDLLENGKKKNEKTKAQKIVLILLIISILLCLMVGIALVILSLHTENKPYTISINNTDVNLNELQLINGENGEKYISLKVLCNKLGYSYYNGEYKIAEEDKQKCYVDNGISIIQFFSNSNKIYKTSEKSITDYEYYILQNNIVSFEDNLYIAINDISVGLNLIVSNSSENNKTFIETPENWLNRTANTFKENEITVSSTNENTKALCYGYVVINKDNRYGVINLRGEELIGNKYSEITFVEYTKQFIVSNTDKQYGIITSDGSAKVNLQYDSIEILNYDPLLYKVKKSQNFGILKENGTIIKDVVFNSIGYSENKDKGIDYTLIIPKLNENIPESIVVCSNGKYGLLNIENGEMVINCTLKGIYSATNDGVVYYIVETQEKKYFLEDYINNVNRVTVKLN